MSQEARVVVDLDVPLDRISRHVYGHFAEHLGRCIYDGFYVGEDSEIPNENGIRLDVVEALRELDVPNLRWPGGCFADFYHWQDGIGPKDQRPSMVNAHWGDVLENNHFGTHEFMDLCEMLGADPYVNGNVGSGTVQEMSDWIEYLTRPGDSPMSRLRAENGREEPWTVPFWGVGNEGWGCGGNMSARHFADEARRFATFARDFGDNKLYKIAAGAAVDDLEWTEELMRAATGCLGCTMSPNRLFHAISFHYYTRTEMPPLRGDATEFSVDEHYRAMAGAQDMDRIIKGHVAVMDRYDPNGTIDLICDEWGTWWNVEEGTHPRFLFQQNTLRDALVASTTLDIFHRHARRLKMANIAQTVNVLQAMILTDGETMIKTPTFHVFEMNRMHQDATSVPVHILGGPGFRTANSTPFDLITASASVRDGSALVSLSNVDAEEAVDIVLDLRGVDVAAFEGRLLTASTLQTHNSAQDPDAVAPVPLDGIERHPRGLRVSLPRHSFATITLELATV